MLTTTTRRTQRRLLRFLIVVLAVSSWAVANLTARLGPVERPVRVRDNINFAPGMVLDAVMLRTNAFARIAVCGMIAGYDGAPLPMTNPALILVNRMKVQGFIVSEHMEIWPEALQELGTLVGTGKLRPRETVAQGLAAAPEAFLGLLKGKNFGKQLVKLV